MLVHVLRLLTRPTTALTAGCLLLAGGLWAVTLERVDYEYRDAIADAGKLLVVERVIRGGNEPDAVKFSDLNMLVMLGGRERSADEFQTLYAEAGFRLTRVVPTETDFSIIEGVPV